MQGRHETSRKKKPAKKIQSVKYTSKHNFDINLKKDVSIKSIKKRRQANHHGDEKN